ncbi:hypothetical protein [Mycobacterium sp.]|uniref:hypothetical protein n=1 Tax=Mycobacterium sp. TaxID=1785 RepID=UPI003F957125
MVLVEGEAAGGATVDQDAFHVTGDAEPPPRPTPAPNVGPPRQQWLPPHSGADDHGGQDWLRRHGIPVP